MSNNKQQPKPENPNNQFSNTEPLTHAQRIAIANTMSNNKQSMKLYTEEQVRHIFENLNISSGYDYNMELYCISITPIELPSDEEIHDKSIKYYTNITASFYFELGAKWMRDLIQRGNK